MKAEKGNALPDNDGSQEKYFPKRVKIPALAPRNKIKKQQCKDALSFFGIRTDYMRLKKDGLYVDLLNKKDGKLELKNSELFSRLTELLADPRRSQYASRILHLENKNFLTTEEEYELEIYQTADDKNDPNFDLCQYAKRIAELKVKQSITENEIAEMQNLQKVLGPKTDRCNELKDKQDKSAAEQKEYDILKADILRFAELRAKEKASQRDNAELQTLLDIDFRPKAQRYVELSYNTHKTELEQKEYQLLYWNFTRPFADRILELEQKAPRSLVEDREYAIINAFSPEGAREIAETEALEKNNALEKDKIIDNYLCDFYQALHDKKQPRPLEAIEKRNLSLSTLPYLEKEKLAQLYLRRICNIHNISIDDIFTNYHSISFNPTLNCYLRDKWYDVTNREIAGLRAVEFLFDFTAQQITDAQMKQMKTENLSSNEITALRHEMRSMIMLALLKYQFDKSLPERASENHHKDIGQSIEVIKNNIIDLIKQQSFKVDVTSLDKAYFTLKAGIDFQSNEQTKAVQKIEDCEQIAAFKKDMLIKKLMTHQKVALSDEEKAILESSTLSQAQKESLEKLYLDRICVIKPNNTNDIFKDVSSVFNPTTNFYIRDAQDKTAYRGVESLFNHVAEEIAMTQAKVNHSDMTEVKDTSSMIKLGLLKMYFEKAQPDALHRENLLVSLEQAKKDLIDVIGKGFLKIDTNSLGKTSLSIQMGLKMADGIKMVEEIRHQQQEKMRLIMRDEYPRPAGLQL